MTGEKNGGPENTQWESIRGGWGPGAKNRIGGGNPICIAAPVKAAMQHQVTKRKFKCEDFVADLRYVILICEIEDKRQKET